MKCGWGGGTLLPHSIISKMVFGAQQQQPSPFPPHSRPLHSTASPTPQQTNKWGDLGAGEASLILGPNRQQSQRAGGSSALPLRSHPGPTAERPHQPPRASARFGRLKRRSMQLLVCMLELRSIGLKGSGHLEGGGLCLCPPGGFIACATRPGRAETQLRNSLLFRPVSSTVRPDL